VSDERRYRISLSRKAAGGKVFVNLSAEIDDPQDAAEVARVRADLQSPGLTSIVEALEDRLDDDINAEIARIRGERRDRIGLAPLPEPKRQKTHAAPKQAVDINGAERSTVGQVSRIRQLITEEAKAGVHPARMNYLKAVMKREDVLVLEDISFTGAAKILDRISPPEDKEFTEGTIIAQRDGIIAIPRPLKTEEEERALAEANDLAHDAALSAVIDADIDEKREVNH